MVVFKGVDFHVLKFTLKCEILILNQAEC